MYLCSKISLGEYHAPLPRPFRLLILQKCHGHLEYGFGLPTTSRLLQAMLALVAEVQHSAGITETSLLNFVVSDGRTLIASRCVFPEQDAAASLYYSEGAAFQRSGQGLEGPGAKVEQSSDAARNCGKAESRNPTNPASARDSSVTGNLYLAEGL